MVNELLSMSLSSILVSVLDIAIVAYVFYRFFLLVRGTRAVQLIQGLLVLLLLGWVSKLLKLTTVNYLLSYLPQFFVVALPVVFQPELRRMLEQVGRGRLFINTAAEEEQQVKEALGEVVSAASRMSRSRIGALIVLERDTGLGEWIETGIQLDAVISREFLVNIFVPNTPLHDGAVIVRGSRLVAAACYLPLSDSPDIGKEVGSRHRAALGISEQSDAVALVVSEETGNISLANSGKLIRHLDKETLEDMLVTLLKLDQDSRPFFFWPRSN